MKPKTKNITYFMFHLLTPKSVLFFGTFAPTSIDDSDFNIR